MIKVKGMGHQLIVVVGGGEVARKYIKIAQQLGASEFVCDLIGIEVSRLNARLLITKLGSDAYVESLENLCELRRAFQSDKILVLGGLQPGQSTNAVGILSAEAVNADLFINATDVDEVYTTDPKENKRAKRLDVVETDALLKMLLTKKLEAGTYALFDPVAVKIVERSGITTRIIDGRDPTNIERIIKGEALGTLVKSSLKSRGYQK